MTKLPMTGAEAFSRPVDTTIERESPPEDNGGSKLKRHGIEFDRINRVAPGESLRADAGTLNLLQPGVHKLREHKRLIDNNRVGIVGEAGARETTIRGPADRWLVPFVVRSDDGFLLEDINFDQRKDTTSAVAVKMFVGDRLEVHDIRFRGQVPNENTSPENAEGYLMAPHVTDPDGTGNLVGIDSRARGIVGDYPVGNGHGYIGPGHRGTMWIRENYIEGSAMHSWYASRSNGTVHVRGGTFKNNVNTQLRLSRDSTVKGAKILIDAPQSRFLDPDGRKQNVRGIRWERAKWNGSSGGLIENCRLICRSGVLGQGLIAVDGSAGELIIRGCELHNTTDGYRNIVAEEIGDNYRDTEPPGDEWVRVEGCSLSGGGGQPLVTDRRGSVDVSVD
jgi:hypothetical protein